MKAHPLTLLAAIILVFFATVAYGEYYQYTDPDGVVRFTDDRSLIPENSQTDVQSYESVYSDYPPVTYDRPSTYPETQPGTTTDDDSTRKEYDEINTMNVELQQTFNELQAEKQALGNPPPRNAKEGERKAYNQKVNDLNRKIEDYQQRSREYQQKIDVFQSRNASK